MTAKVDAGYILHDFLDYLATYGRGYTLGNFPWFTFQTVGGAVATGSHGSSLSYGSLSSDELLVALDVVLANGTLAGGNGLVASGLVHVGLGLPLLVSAACTLWFSGATMALHDQGALSSDYVRESLEGTGIWDVM
jgi:FAD/FMN-containing dehydrogenase